MISVYLDIWFEWHTYIPKGVSIIMNDSMKERSYVGIIIDDNARANMAKEGEMDVSEVGRATLRKL